MVYMLMCVVVVVVLWHIAVSWNWMSSDYGNPQHPEAFKAKVAAADNCCEHVSADPSVAFVIHAENDPWGRETYASCQACDKAAQEEEDKQPTVCDDCKETFPRKEVHEWRWYDFYAPQGDQPLMICVGPQPEDGWSREGGCWVKPKHTARVQRDRQARDEELGHFDD